MPFGSGGAGIQLGVEAGNATTDILIDNGALILTALGAAQGEVIVQETASGSVTDIKSRSIHLTGGAQQLLLDDGGVIVKTLMDQTKLLIGYTVAPADGELNSSQLAFWFDPTPGVGNTKLMVKAKDAGGTVRTAAIVLA